MSSLNSFVLDVNKQLEQIFLPLETGMMKELSRGENAFLSTFTLVRELKDCGHKKDLQTGKLLHSKATQLGWHTNIYVANTLISMYSRCGDVSEARGVFDTMRQRDVVSWTAMMVGYMENGNCSLVLDMFRSMSCQPNRVTLVVALRAFTALVCINKLDKESCLQEGISVHKRAVELGCERDKYVASTLINMYSRCGDMVRARETFDKMIRRDVVFWNILILGYVENGEYFSAWELFDRMDCLPNSSTFAAVLKACTRLAMDRKLEKERCLEKGVIVHGKAIEFKVDKDLAVASTLVDMYSKCGDMTHARRVFDEMAHRDVVSWTALVVGYVDNGQSSTALETFKRMDCTPDRVAVTSALRACASLAVENKEMTLHEGIAIHTIAKEQGFDKDTTVANTLVDMYSKCGDLERARTVFDGIPVRCDVSWNALILGYVENGESSLALDVYMSMNCSPNQVTMVAALKACGILGALETGYRIHSQVCMLGWEQEEMVATSLVDFYGKCSSVDAAENIFRKMHTLDIAVWNSLIGGYSSLGNTNRVFSLVREMQETGIQVNSVTILLILSACNHAGMVQQGQRCFENMINVYGVEPEVEHYACMVDMLGRANKLAQALLLAKQMPIKASISVWMALLAACKKWDNLEIGEAVFDILVKLGEAPAAYVLMRDIYEKTKKLFY